MSGNKLDGLKISLCQMDVVPGRPDINAAYIMEEIANAREWGVDIIAFPEACLTGYLIGDKFENISFMRDVLFWMERIVASTDGITAIFGTPMLDEGLHGENGGPRKYNAAVVASNGRVVGGRPYFRVAIKTLQPHYRLFADGKHFFDLRKIAEEAGRPLREYMEPFVIDTRLGQIKIGVILCEDMWHEDYAKALNPTRDLVTNGAEIIFNLSASPWSWQKNRKRHQVVRNLLADSPVPFVYVNNTGVQNPGKNIVMFDGSSAVYNRNGEVIFEVGAYATGACDFTFKESLPALPLRSQNDPKELYEAMVAGVKFVTPPWVKKVIAGLSGGVDSATVATLMVSIFGKDRVLGVNMPYKDYNKPETEDLARKVAVNLGIEYLVMPIDKRVAQSQETGVEEGTLAFENAQARARTAVLAELASVSNGVFTCNSNKVEIAFGYSTLYGDYAGYYAPLGDLVKREVRQMADYMNREIFGRIVIPDECINAVPTAGLRPDQFDPFDYGDLTRRGYHDEMTRAFVEFRLDPEWFLEQYLGGRLEGELLLEPGTLARLFPTSKELVEDLERCWELFHRSYFKRIQSPPIPVYSRRAFGRDLEESMLTAHYTQRYEEYKAMLIA